MGIRLRPKQILWIGAVLILLAAILSFFVESKMKETEPSKVSASVNAPLLLCFDESNAEFVSMAVQSWAKVDDRFHDRNELEPFYRKIKKSLGSDMSISEEIHDDENYAGYSVSGKTEQGYSIDLVLQSIGGEDAAGETYLIANIVDTQKVKDLRSVEKFLKRVFTSISCKGDPSVVLEGKYDGMRSENEKKAIAEKIFQTLGARIEEYAIDDDYVSYSGYSDKIACSVTSDDHKINLQVALSDNEVQGCTHIYIGSPVVFSEF